MTTEQRPSVCSGLEMWLKASWPCDKISLFFFFFKSSLSLHAQQSGKQERKVRILQRVNLWEITHNAPHTWWKEASRFYRRIVSIDLQLLHNCSRVPFDNDTSHARLYLTLGMLFCAEWLTFVSIETGVEIFQCGLCNWIWWIRPFRDNGAVRLRGHQRALTP